MTGCRSIPAALLLALFSMLLGTAQEKTANNSAAVQQMESGNGEESGVVLKPGTFLVAEFNGGLNAAKLKPGDKVKASLSQELITNGRVIAPEDARLIGHVTEARPRTPDGESRLGIIFDKLLLKQHKELRFVASVYSLEPPSQRPSRADRPSQMALPNGGRARSARTPGALTDPSASTSIGGGTPARGPVTAAGKRGAGRGDRNDPVSSPQPQIATNAPASAGNGKRPGVYGIKNLALGPIDSATPGLVIVSQDATVKLEDGTQVVLVITSPASLAATK
jgi:hypothetical protein